jgi:hypothetical protein
MSSYILMMLCWSTDTQQNSAQFNDTRQNTKNTVSCVTI